MEIADDASSRQKFALHRASLGPILPTLAYAKDQQPRFSNPLQIFLHTERLHLQV